MNTCRSIKLAFAVAAMVVSSSAISDAADVQRGPAYRPPPPIPFYNWSGFYAGGQIGVGWDDGSSGVIGGGQVGYNFQISPQWVLGVEADIAATSIGASASSPFISVSGGLDWVSTLAPRLGYAFDRWLVYGKVGGAWAHSSVTVSSPFLGSFSQESTVSGWMLGLGVEYALQGNWTAKVEYNRMDFGSDPFTDNKFNVFKAGINYRFGGPGGLF